MEVDCDAAQANCAGRRLCAANELKSSTAQLRCYTDTPRPRRCAAEVIKHDFHRVQAARAVKK
jgi:hypothetical protein